MFEDIGKLRIEFIPPKINLQAAIIEAEELVKKAIEQKANEIIANKEYMGSLLKHAEIQLHQEINNRIKSMVEFYADEICGFLKHDLVKNILVDSKIK
jgi:hypothetical protein